MTSAPAVGMHYHLEAYVCGAGCVKPSPFEGWATFTQIFWQRPNACRFAVARMIPVFDAEPRGPWVCWDLYSELMFPAASPRGYVLDVKGLLTPPYPRWQGDSADALIMKAMVYYDRD